MSPLPRLTVKEAEQRLLRAGFNLARQKGSHKIYRKGSFRMALPWHQGKILHPKIVKELLEIIRRGRVMTYPTSLKRQSFRPHEKNMPLCGIGLPVRDRTCLRASHRQAQTGGAVSRSSRVKVGDEAAGSPDWTHIVNPVGWTSETKPYARFDEGGLVMVSMDWLLRHRQTKGAATDRPIPNDGRSLSSTLPGTPRVLAAMSRYKSLTPALLFPTK